ncbi:MAG: hypothetical protein ABI615_06580 [Chthoniobacterales bacterium]
MILPPHTPLTLVALFCLFALPAHAGNSSAPIIREEGALYLSDFGSKPLKTEVLQPAPAYFHIKMQDYAGTLRAPQAVEIVALNETGDAYRIRGQAQQGQILGWVSTQFVKPLSPELVSNLKKAAERKKIVDALIAQNQVAMGMTPAEVQQSLGKPTKKTNKANQTRTEQTWEYIKYASVPQQVTSYDNRGNLVTSTIYVQKPVGRLTVVFSDNLVSSLEQSEGTISSDSEVRVVVPPVIVY